MTPTPDQVSAGLKHSQDDYLRFDPCEGDMDVDIRCRTIALRKARKQYPCFMGAGNYGDQHTINPGETYRYEKALVDGDFWGTYRCCVPCMDKWLDEINGDGGDE